MLPATDEQLAHRARSGDAAAIHRLVDRHAAALYRAAYHLLGRDADAQDLVQETLLAMVQSISRFEARSSFRTWLWAILMRQSALMRRRHRPAAALEHMGDLSRPSALAASDARIDVHAALQAMSDEHRHVLVLREIEGLSYAEIAAVLDIAVGTVESRLFRARQHLRRLLPAYEPGRSAT